MADPVSDLTGTTVGRFAVRARLGAGGMGEVYRAEDLKLKRSVALKRMAPQLRADERYRQRFLKEAQRASGLTDQRIAGLYDVFEEGGETFLVMEYVEGETLRQRLQRPLSIEQFLEIAAQCAEALVAAHAAGIVHRDLKPENIMLTPAGQVKVLDFGVAKRLPRPDKTADTASLESARSAGSLSGTPAYMAPETLLERDADGRADIFSLGVVFYEALTGRHPFLAGGFMVTSDRILHEEPPPLTTLNPRAPAELERVVAKMLAKRPEERYATAADLLVDLRALQRGERIELRPSPPAPQPWYRRRLILAAGGVVVVGAFLVGVEESGLLDQLRGPDARIESLAVLPLRNLSGDPDQEYFADGMTEALIADLQKVRALRVISRTSMMTYKGADKPLPQIARELNVDGIVEGSVLRVGGRVRITAQLFHGPTERNLWGETYERDLGDVLSLQGEVARAIASEIRVKLTPQEQILLGRARPVKPEAYEAYLQGRYHWNRGGEDERKKAKEYFEQAVALDPDYAAAYAGLADYYWATSELSSEVAIPKAYEYILKALELDPQLAHVHASLGAIRYLRDWEWAAAEEEFKRALELDPNDAQAHQFYSAYLSAQGRFEEALVEVQRAQELDPLSLLMNVSFGWAFYFARQYDRATEQCQEALKLDPNSPGAHACLGQSYRALGRHEQAIAESQLALTLSRGDPVRAVGLACAYGAAGRNREAAKIFDELQLRAQRRYVPPYLLATIHACLGHTEETFAALEKAYRERDRHLAWLKVDQAFDPLRSDPRFRNLLRRLGLPL